MAILQEYRKVRQTEQKVEYVFGYPEKDRQLSCDEAKQARTVADGRLDPATQAVVRGILRRQRAETTWPNGAGVQH